ncbi:MAG: FAD-dependent oxidoreductase [Pseudomonadota bacterium]
MKIAVIGSGISGIVASHYLSKANHQITLFESEDYIGGHTHTIDVLNKGKIYPVDTGFIVFNDKTYPNYLRFLSELNVDYQNTEMTFSVKNDISGLEYNGNNLDTLFAQRKNIFNIRFLRTIRDILKFNKSSKKRIENSDLSDSLTLGELVKLGGYSQGFVDDYLLPMGAAIWSTSLKNMLDFPADFFLRFFENHGLLNISERPQWHVIKGGSNQYVKRFLNEFSGEVKLSTPIKKVQRHADNVTLMTANNQSISFDKVIFATHSNQVLPILDKEITEDEQNVLGRIGYEKNEIVLHTDTQLLPKSQKAWASWNYNLYDRQHKNATLTYNMNILQSIQHDETFCVTLNSTDRIDASKIIDTFHYDHPQFTIDAIEARKERHKVQGKNHTYFCGAYWYNGFHEDGVRSALEVCQALGTDIEILIP